MIEEIRQLIHDYINWLKDKTLLREVGSSWVEITTPCLDRHNDYIQIYVKKEGHGYLLTDDRYTITDLEQSGCNLDSPKRKDLLKVTLNGFGVANKEGELLVHASADNFALRKHNLIQAIMAVNDLFYLAAPTIASVFYEDVQGWLDLNEVRYTSKVKFTGKSSFDHLFDFVIPSSRKQPERLLRAVNRPNKETVQLLTFSWIDIKEVRPQGSRIYAFLNDREREISEGVVDALRNYDINPVLWSQREDYREQLAA
ncbi:MAG: DUF1829 domain-containing protein [Candidatus Omnitrophica bacterium]|nr:DUF1829 domain-containing protein [Candidatus Omnitrophota bacterium]